MTGRSWVRAAFRLAAAVFAASSAAAAGPDWLQSCLISGKPPWRADAAALQLLNSTQVSFLSPRRILAVYRSVRRIDREDGMNHFSFLTPYNADTDRILSAEAWVISPDGKDTRSFARGAFVDRVLQDNKYFWDAERVLQFDGQSRVEMGGGTVACEVKIERDLGVGNVSDQFLNAMMTLHSVFEVTPAPGTKLEWFAQNPSFRSPRADPTTGSLRWELDRLPSAPVDGPTGFHPDRMRVEVRCAPLDPSAVQLKTWRDFSQIAAQIMDPRLDSGGAVKTEADLLVALKTARWDRIRALCEFVQKEIVYLAITLDKDSVAGYRPHPAAEVLRNRFGDCKDKATLLVSLLRASGEDGRVVLLMAADPSYVTEEWPSAQFNHAIAAIPADADTPAGWPVTDAGPLGKFVIFDPTDPTTPLGILSPSDQGGFGVVVDPTQGALVRLPVSDADHSGLVRRIEVAPNPQGGLMVKVEENRRGINAAEYHLMRWNLPKDRFQSLLEQRIHQTHPLCGDLNWSDDWNASEGKYRLAFGFTIPTYGQTLGGSLVVLTPDILPSQFKLAAWKGRRDGISWLGADALQEEVRLTLPAGSSLEELPDPWSEEGKTVSCQLSYRIEGDVVIFRHRWQRRAGFYGAGDYHALEELYQRIIAAERRPIVLRQRRSF